MKQINSYSAYVQRNQNFAAPRGAEILSAKMEDGVLKIYALTDLEPVERHCGPYPTQENYDFYELTMLPTGGTACGDPGQYLGNVEALNDKMMLHVFVKKSINKGAIDMFTNKELNKLKRKYSTRTEIDALEYRDGHPEAEIDVWCFGYQAHGMPGKISDGIITMNRLTDEKQDRPKGYWLAHRFETSPGWNICIMVSDHWLETHKGMDKHKAAWEKEFKEAK